MREDKKVAIDVQARKIFQDLLRYDDDRVINEIYAVEEMLRRGMDLYDQDYVYHFDLSKGSGYVKKLYLRFGEIIKAEIGDEMYSKIDLLKMGICLDVISRVPRKYKKVNALLRINEALSSQYGYDGIKETIELIELAAK